MWGFIIRFQFLQLLLHAAVWEQWLNLWNYLLFYLTKIACATLYFSRTSLWNYISLDIQHWGGNGMVTPSKENLCIAKIPSTEGRCSEFRCLWCRFYLVSTGVSVSLAKIPRLFSSLAARICRAGRKRLEVQIGDRLPTHEHWEAAVTRSCADPCHCFSFITSLKPVKCWHLKHL